MDLPPPPPLAFPLDPAFTIIGAADTGTYASGVIAGALVEDHPEFGELDHLFIFEEFPNYRYVGGVIEELGISTREWCQWYSASWDRYRTGLDPRAWADKNTQFRSEYRHHGVRLMMNKVPLDVRTDRAKSYVHAKIQCLWLAPWLQILPYELERAKWPPSEESAGRTMRLKFHDHTLDCLEHICSKKPRGRQIDRPKRKSFLEQMYDQHKRIVIGGRMDRHLGRL